MVDYFRSFSFPRNKEKEFINILRGKENNRGYILIQERIEHDIVDGFIDFRYIIELDGYKPEPFQLVSFNLNNLDIESFNDNLIHEHIISQLCASNDKFNNYIEDIMKQKLVYDNLNKTLDRYNKNILENWQRDMNRKHNSFSLSSISHHINNILNN